MADTLVVGVGNPLRGDDGIGPAVVEWLRARRLPADVELIDARMSGLDLALTLTGCRRAVVIDAADMGRAPGEWARLTPQQVCPADRDGRLSPHAAGLAEALALGAALGTLPEQVVIFGVQPAQVTWSIGLSAAARRAVSGVGQAILHEIGADPSAHNRGE